MFCWSRPHRTDSVRGLDLGARPAGGSVVHWTTPCVNSVLLGILFLNSSDHYYSWFGVPLDHLSNGSPRCNS
jgi:hypothetical protein